MLLAEMMGPCMHGAMVGEKRVGPCMHGGLVGEKKEGPCMHGWAVGLPKVCPSMHEMRGRGFMSRARWSFRVLRRVVGGFHEDHGRVLTDLLGIGKGIISVGCDSKWNRSAERSATRRAREAERMCAGERGLLARPRRHPAGEWEDARFGKGPLSRVPRCVCPAGCRTQRARSPRSPAPIFRVYGELRSLSGRHQHCYVADISRRFIGADGRLGTNGL